MIYDYVKIDEKTNNNALSEKEETPAKNVKDKIINDKLSSTQNKNIIKENGETKSFTDLKESIIGNVSNDNYVITLEHDYKYGDDDDFTDGIGIRGTTPYTPDGYIVIGTDKTLVINGNGKTIDADGKTRLFDVRINAKLRLENLTIINCYSSTSGGVIFEDSVANITIINCIFKNNTASYDGGAIYVSYSTLKIINSTIENNTAYNGGAIYGYDEYAEVIITNTTLEKNTATNYGGAIYIFADSILIIKNSTLQQNNATTTGINPGSAIYLEYGAGNDIQFNKFIDNEDNLNSVNIKVPSNNKFLTTPVFEIEHISDFVKGNPITITVSEKKGITDELNINLTIGTEIYTIKLKNGIGEKTITPNLNPGTYKAILNFTETDNYMSTSSESNEFQIKPKVINSNIQIENIPNFEVGQEIIIHVTADNTFNNELNITINGTQYPITITNGQGSTKIIPNLKPGEYNATINYSGDEIYPPITVTSNKFRVRNITELLDTINQLQLKINELIKANETLTKNIITLQNKINELLQNNITLTQKINAQNDTINMLDAKIKNQNAQLENKISLLEGNIIILQNSFAEAINKINQLSNTNHSNVSPKTSKKLQK